MKSLFKARYSYRLCVYDHRAVSMISYFFDVIISQSVGPLSITYPIHSMSSDCGSITICLDFLPLSFPRPFILLSFLAYLLEGSVSSLAVLLFFPCPPLPNRAYPLSSHSSTQISPYSHFQCHRVLRVGEAARYIGGNPLLPSFSSTKYTSYLFSTFII